MFFNIIKNANKPNTIAISIPCLLTGGTEVATLETALALNSFGYSVDVVVYFDEVDVAMLETFEASGIVVYLLGVHRGGGLHTHWILANRLFCLLRRKSYRAIWIQYMTPTLLPLIVARLFTHKLIAAVHVAASHYSPSSLKRISLLAQYWCTRFVCVSCTVADGIFGAPDNELRQHGRIVVIPNALDMQLMRKAQVLDWRVQTGWPVDAVVIGFAGRLTHIKGVDVLIQSVADMNVRELPIRLVIVGDGPERAGLERMTQQLGIAHITHFAGRLPREMIFNVIKGFDIAAMPSREEGFGLSALEAMAAGVPVVASRIDALKEVVQDGVTGLLCQVDDSQSLADALTRLVADKTLRKRMGVAGIAHVTQHYDRPVYRGHISKMFKVLGLPVRSPV